MNLFYLTDFFISSSAPLSTLVPICVAMATMYSTLVVMIDIIGRYYKGDTYSITANN